MKNLLSIFFSVLVAYTAQSQTGTVLPTNAAGIRFGTGWAESGTYSRNGTLIYNSTTNQFRGYKNGSWQYALLSANDLTMAGTNATTMTFPTTSATIARTDAAQTFTGIQTFSSDINLNGTNPTIASTNTGTASVFHTNILTGSIFGAASTINVGGVNAGAITHNYSGNPTLNTTKVVNIGLGNSGTSTTTINLATTNVGTNNINLGSSAGTFTINSPSVTQSNNQNAGTSINVSNTTAGTASRSFYTVTSDASAGAANFQKLSSTFTAASIYSGSDLLIFNGTAGNISILNNYASGTIRLAAGASSTPHLTIASTGASTFSTDLLGSSTTQNLFNTVATTMNFAGAATALNVGASTGTFTIGNPTITGTNATALNLNGVSPSIATTSTGTASVFNTNALTGNLFGASNTISIGSTTTAQQTVNLFTSSTTNGSVYNFATGAITGAISKTVNIGTTGAANSTLFFNVGSTTSNDRINLYGQLTQGNSTSAGANLTHTFSGTPTTLNSFVLDASTAALNVGGANQSYAALNVFPPPWTSSSLTGSQTLSSISTSYAAIVTNTGTPFDIVGLRIKTAVIGVASNTVKGIIIEAPTGVGSTPFTAIDAVGDIKSKHLVGSTSAPSIAAGTGAGTTPTVSVTGNDISGLVNVITGTTPTGTNAIVVTVTFNTAFSVAPKVVLVPANRNAQALAVASQVLVPAAGQTNGITTTTFVIESGATALAASTNYLWQYHTIQ